MYTASVNIYSIKIVSIALITLLYFTLTYPTCATRENIYIDPHSFILSVQNRRVEYKLHTLYWSFVSLWKKGRIQVKLDSSIVVITNVIWRSVTLIERVIIYINCPVHCFGFPQVVEYIPYEFLQWVWLEISAHHHPSSVGKIEFMSRNGIITILKAQ